MKKLFYKNSGIDGRFYRLKGWKARRSGIGIKVPFKVDVTEATQKEMSEAYQIISFLREKPRSSGRGGIAQRH